MNRSAVLISYSCRNKLSQIQQLLTPQMYLLQFRRSEVSAGEPWSVGRSGSSWGSRGSVPLPFPGPGGTAAPPHLCPHHIPFLWLSSRSPGPLCWQWSTLILRSSPILRSLIQRYLQAPPSATEGDTFSLGIKTCTSLGGHYSSNHQVLTSKNYLDNVCG